MIDEKKIIKMQNCIKKKNTHSFGYVLPYIIEEEHRRKGRLLKVLEYGPGCNTEQFLESNLCSLIVSVEDNLSWYNKFDEEIIKKYPKSKIDYKLIKITSPEGKAHDGGHCWTESETNSYVYYPNKYGNNFFDIIFIDAGDRSDKCVLNGVKYNKGWPIRNMCLVNVVKLINDGIVVLHDFPTKRFKRMHNALRSNVNKFKFVYKIKRYETTLLSNTVEVKKFQNCFKLFQEGASSIKTSESNSIKFYIKKIPGIYPFYLRYKKEIFDGFHGDKINQQYVLKLISFFKTSSFLETGTWQGDTTGFVAAHNKRLPVFTCEINPNFFEHSRIRLKKFKNIKIFNQSSEQFIAKSNTDSLNIGNMPLFYLDAHWYDYWPLLDELRVIIKNYSPVIILIDDFEVPGRPDYKFDIGGGGSLEWSGKKIIDKRKTNIDLIFPLLKELDEFKLLFPSYTFEETNTNVLVGYITIFFGLDKEFQELMKDKFITQHFKSYLLQK